MKFEEALKHLRDGKKIARNGWHKPFGEYSSIMLPDMLAEDWEVVEKKVEITREQFFEAVCDVKKTIIGQPMVYSEKHFLQYLADRLGL